MIEEKQFGSIKWYTHNNLRFRVKEIEGLKIVAWVTDDFNDISFTLVMNDFINRCEENGLDISIDKSWNKHRGFIADKEDLNLLLGEMINFISEYDIEKDENGDKISEEEWYMDK